MKQVKQCMSPLKAYSVDQGGIFLLMSSLDKTSQLCSEGKIQNAFACLNKIYNNCAKSKEGTQHFDLLVDVGKWHRAMDNICNNIHYLQDHAECETKAYLEYKPCAEKEVEFFAQQLASTWAEMASPSTVNEEEKTEAVMDVGCSFTIKILDCLRAPFTKYCPKQLTNLLVSTVEDFMPPACVKRALINTIHRIPKYKHIGHEKPKPDNHINNSNNNSNNNNINTTSNYNDDHSSSIAMEIVIASTPPAAVDNLNTLDNPREGEKPQNGHVIGPPLGTRGTEEAVGSVRSPDELDSFSLRLTGNRWLAILFLVTCRLVSC